MPNWVYNKVIVSGEREEVASVVNAARDSDTDLSFHAVVPVPEELQAGPYVLDESECSYPEGIMDFDEKFDYRLKHPQDMYSWQLANWGCKRGAVDVKL